MPILLLLFVLAGLQAQTPPQGYACPRAAAPIRIDGLIDEQWRQAPWTSDFADIEGDRKPKPRFRTRAKMQWDSEYFYIAAELEEPHVWGTITRHDAVIFHDNDFEVFVDPNGDSHEYFEFEMNVLNTGWDLFLPKPYKDKGSADNGWEIPGLRTAVKVNGTLNKPGDVDQGWTLEIAIPWKAFGEAARMPLPPRAGDQWRVNFSRVEWQHELHGGAYRRVPKTKEDNWVWSPQGKINMHLPEHWGYVRFDERPGGERPADATWATRMRLQAYYERQKEFFKTRHRWATAGELPQEKGIEFRPGTGGEWRACAERLCIRQDALVTRD
ncbi:MAG: carbohydrate-binding family 9-like protein [Bryobacterales bacterium]|nr:carbohydrate-binding family 9-like protein [Bryobacterales bacterium]